MDRGRNWEAESETYVEDDCNNLHKDHCTTPRRKIQPCKDFPIANFGLVLLVRRFVRGRGRRRERLERVRSEEHPYREERDTHYRTQIVEVSIQKEELQYDSK